MRIVGPADGESALKESGDVKLRSVKMKGKYSFQYMENLEIDDCELDTKDAFWHSKNVTVKDSIVKGHIISVKNPKSGRIIADSVGKVIRGDAVMECTGEVILRTETEKKAESVSEASKYIA